MSDVRGLLGVATARLAGEDARFEAELLLAHALGRTRAWLFAWPEFEPDPSTRTRFEDFVEARRRGTPVAYLTGHRSFWSLDLEVTPDVLIPRADTELLVELALARIAPDQAATIADLGTGSGAIALAIARDRPQARVLATDASSAALEVARRNAERLGIGNVDFALGDWYAALADARFDLIVSNPPYIESADAHLVQGDLVYEPAAALVSGADGLDAIRCIVASAPEHLSEGGWLLLEHGHRQGDAVRALLTAQPRLRGVRTLADIEGRDRVTLAQRLR